MSKYQTLVNERDALSEFIVNHKNNPHTSADLIISHTLKKFERCLRAYLLALKGLCMKKFPQNRDLEESNFNQIIRFASKHEILFNKDGINDLIKFHNHSKGSYLSEITFKELDKKASLLIKEVDALLHKF